MILTREQIQKVVTEYFAEKPVKKVWLFGSYARGDADEESDVDVLIDVDYSVNVGWDYFIWHEELQKQLNTKVDVVTLAGLSKFIKPLVDKDKSLIYEKA